MCSINLFEKIKRLLLLGVLLLAAFVPVVFALHMF